MEPALHGYAQNQIRRVSVAPACPRAQQTVAVITALQDHMPG